MLIGIKFDDFEWWALRAEKEGGDEGAGGGGEDDASDGLDDLIKEGEDLPPEESADGEGEGDGDEGGGDDDVSARLDSLENSLREKDAELVYLRGELAKKTAPPVTKDEDEEPLYDEAEILAMITDKDAKNGLKAVEKVATKIAERLVKKQLKETESLITTTDQTRSAKEADRDQTMADFREEFNDPQTGQQFLQRTIAAFQENQKNVGNRYLPRSLYQAAALVKVQFDRERASQNGTRNGVTKARPQHVPTNPTESSTDTNKKPVTINDIPSRMLSDRQKVAARAVAKRMGVTEKEWVANFMEEKANDPNFGVG